MRKVIFREDINPYTGQKGFMAIFPEMWANQGRVQIISFHYNESWKKWEYEGSDEGDITIVTDSNKHKIIRKRDERIPELVEAIESIIEDKVEVCEKIMQSSESERYSWREDL